MAERKGCTPGNTALAWVLAQRPYIVPIPGTKKISRLEENVRAVSVVFTEQELKELNDQLNKFEVKGARFDDNQMQFIDK